MKKFILLIVLAALLAAAAYAACIPAECGARDRYAGDPFCKHGDVYDKYVDHFCSAGECESVYTDNKLEDCRYGCIEGGCIQCDSSCNEGDGYYGEPSCRSGDAHQRYRDYRCEADVGCSFNEEWRKIQECGSNFCRNGHCNNTCLPEECDRDDDFYGDLFCKKGNVYREYRDYFCQSSGCAFRRNETLISDCQYACYDGECIECDPSCEEKDGFYEEKFCRNGHLYQEYRNYYCSRDGCKFTTSSQKVEDCIGGCSFGSCISSGTPVCNNFCFGDIFYQGSYNGQCVYNDTNCNDLDYYGNSFCKYNDVYAEFTDHYCTTAGCQPLINDRLVEDCELCESGACILPYAVTGRSFSFGLETITTEKENSYPGKSLFSGALFGRNDMIIYLNKSVKAVNINISRTNQHGSLKILIGSNEFSINEAGEHYFSVSGLTEKIEIYPESSGWVFWSPNVYDISNIIITSDDIIFEQDTFSLSLTDEEYANIVSAQITSRPENTEIIINGIRAKNNDIDVSFLKKENKVQFIPAGLPGERAEITISYRDYL